MAKKISALTAATAAAAANEFEINEAGTSKKVTGSQVGGLVSQGLLFGMTLSNNGTDAVNDIDIAAGRCVDSTGVRLLVGGAMTKRLDATWAAGTGNGGRMSAAGIADTTYHMFAILKDSDGTVDYGFDTSPTAPTMPTGYTLFRRIGSVIRSGATLSAFIQRGDEFLRSVYVNDVITNNPGTSAVTPTLSVPTGIQVGAMISMTLVDNTPATGWVAAVTSPDQADTAPSGNTGSLFIPAAGAGVAQRSSITTIVRTNTSAQIRYRLAQSDADIFVAINTFGWIDARGRAA